MQRVGATLPCGARASHCSGFSCCGARALGSRASVIVTGGLSSCGSQAVEHRLSSCGAQVSLLRSMWDLPGPGLEPMSPALAGRILNHCTTREVPVMHFKGNCSWILPLNTISGFGLNYIIYLHFKIFI